jgi:adenosylcobinamide-GDP ribazoletransferase
LPLVGVAVGAVMLLWDWLAVQAGFGELLSVSGRVLIPLLLTGGIHMDGFLDTIDARRSYQPKEKKLEILKDPHTGAFAIIYGGIYLVAMLGLYSAVSSANLWVVALGFVLSRALGGISVVAFRGAKNTGMVADFRLSAEKKTVFGVLLVFTAVTAALMIVLRPVAGCLAVLGAAGMFGYYRYFSYREFGGITGDMAGYFIQMSELAVAVAAAVATICGC